MSCSEWMPWQRRDLQRWVNTQAHTNPGRRISLKPLSVSEWQYQETMFLCCAILHVAIQTYSCGACGDMSGTPPCLLLVTNLIHVTLSDLLPGDHRYLRQEKHATMHLLHTCSEVGHPPTNWHTYWNSNPFIYLPSHKISPTPWNKLDGVQYHHPWCLVILHSGRSQSEVMFF